MSELTKNLQHLSSFLLTSKFTKQSNASYDGLKSAVFEDLNTTSLEYTRQFPLPSAS